MGMGPTAAAPTSRYKQRSSTPGVGYGAHSYDKQPGKGGAAPGGKGGAGGNLGSMIGADPKQVSQPGGPGGQMPGKGGVGPGMGGQLPPGGNYSDDGNWYQPPMPTAPDGMAQAQVMPQPIWVGQGQPPAGFTPGLGWSLGGGAGGLSPGDVLGRIRPSPRAGGEGMYGSIMDKLQGNQGFLNNFSPDQNAAQLQAMQQKYGNAAHKDPRYQQLLAERDTYGKSLSRTGGPGGPVGATGPAPAIETRPTINRDPRNQATYGPAPNILAKSSRGYSKSAFEDAMRNYDEVMANGPSDPRFGTIVRGGTRYWKDLGISSATGGEDGRGFYDKDAARAYALQRWGRSGFTG